MPNEKNTLNETIKLCEAHIKTLKQEIESIDETIANNLKTLNAAYLPQGTESNYVAFYSDKISTCGVNIATHQSTQAGLKTPAWETSINNILKYFKRGPLSRTAVRDNLRNEASAAESTERKNLKALESLKTLYKNKKEKEVALTQYKTQKETLEAEKPTLAAEVSVGAQKAADAVEGAAESFAKTAKSVGEGLDAARKKFGGLFKAPPKKTTTQTSDSAHSPAEEKKETKSTEKSAAWSRYNNQ